MLTDKQDEMVKKGMNTLENLCTTAHRDETEMMMHEQIHSEWVPFPGGRIV